MPILFLLFWIVLNSRISVEVVVIGIFVSALMSLFLYRLIGISFELEKRIWARCWKLLKYLAALLWEIVKANIQMVKIILSPTLKIQPRIVYFESPVKTDFAKIIMTYSVMLTPGTVIFELEGNRFGIHAIDPAMGEGVTESKLTQRLKKIEEGVDDAGV